MSGKGASNGDGRYGSDSQVGAGELGDETTSQPRPENRAESDAARPGRADVEPAAPEAVRERAEACVGFVERALGVKLDYQPETLPLLDHYVEQGRVAVAARPEMLPVLAQTIGAYLGEVVRRRHPSWWRIEGDDPADFRLELEAVYLAFSPVQLVAEALRLGSGREASLAGADEERHAGEAEVGAGFVAGFVMEEEDRDVVAGRLAELPPVDEREYCAPSTRLEVIDIAVDAIQAKRIAAGEEPSRGLGPEDYED